MRYLIFVTLLILSSYVMADEVSLSLSWEMPTERENGQSLPVSEIKGYEIYYTVDGGAVETLEIINASDSNYEFIADLVPRAQPYKFDFSIATIDTDGLYSEVSEVVTELVMIKESIKPNAPIIININKSCVDRSVCVIVIQGDE